jgi:hypothetical protein
MKLINKKFKGPQMPLSCDMILSRKMRKVLKAVKRIRMKDI